MKTRLFIVSLLAAAVLAAALPAPAQEQKTGGVLNIATIGEPPTLDPGATTADVVGMIGQHFFETLYAFGHGFAVKPLLAAAMPDVTDAGKIYTIPLRKGVKFHNGKEMTSADVVPSIKRWLEKSVRGGQVSPMVKSVAAVDAYTVKIELSAPHTPLLALLAIPTSMAIIIPAENCEGDLKDYTGTGPYKFEEHQPDRYIRVTRFDGYVASADDADLYAGKRTAFADELRFIPVPNANTRLEGALAGQYQYSDQLPIENYNRLVGQAAVEPVMTDPYGWPIMFLNCREGKMTNLKMRQAVQAALSQEDMMAIAFGEPEFYSADGALYPEGYFYYSDKGLDLYNQNNPEKAKQLLKEANYDGSPVRILTSMQYEFHFKMAQVSAENLRAAGMEVQLDVVDWATLTQQRGDPSKWDLYYTHSPFVPDPFLNNFFNDEYPGWWVDAKKTELANAFNAEPDLNKRAAIFGELQQYAMETAANIKIGNFNMLAGKAKNVKGYEPSSWPSFWNVSVE
jgi:peptide/nickel transport system substrate-binding protein